MATDMPVTLAAIAGAHGVTGEVRLKLFGEGVAALKCYRAFNDSTLTLKKLRDDGKGGAIARFEEVPDRTAGDVLEIERAEPDDKGRVQRFMVPMIASAVPEWDASRVVVVAAFVE